MSGGGIRRFQFLMVRLKEPQFAVLSAFFYISIPYGAIKRTNAVVVATPYLTFQFLMVRLKGKLDKTTKNC